MPCTSGMTSVVTILMASRLLQLRAFVLGPILNRALIQSISFSAFTLNRSHASQHISPESL